MVLFDKHPLSGTSKALKVWIDGHEYFDRERDLENRPKFQEKKKALLEKENASGEKGKDRPRTPVTPSNSGANL